MPQIWSLYDAGLNFYLRKILSLEPFGVRERHTEQPTKGLKMSGQPVNGQINGRSVAYWVALVVVHLIVGLGASWWAWLIALPFGDPVPKGDLPMEFVFLALSLMFFYAGAAIGSWALSRSGRTERAALRMAAISIGVITIYGLSTSAVFVLAAWSPSAVVAAFPAAVIGYILYQSVDFSRQRRRTTEGSTYPDTPTSTWSSP